jgi:hypothetical protein
VTIAAARTRNVDLMIGLLSLDVIRIDAAIRGIVEKTFDLEIWY